MGAVWIPDWPVVSAGMHLGEKAGTPLAVTEGGKVVAANPQARALGVRDAMTSRQVRMRGVRSIPRSREREAIDFELVVEAVHRLVANCLVISSGDLVFVARGPVKSAGNEERLAEALIGVIAEETGTEAHIGFGEGALCAVVAAREDAAPQCADEFLADKPVGVLRLLAASGRIERECSDYLSALEGLGVRTLGQLKTMDKTAVISRFGGVAQWAYRLVEGEDSFSVKSQSSEKHVSVLQTFDTPIANIEQAAFIARHMAHELSEKLSYHGKSARGLLVNARSEQGGERARAWYIEAPTERDIVDRVRWQLASWIGDGEHAPRSALVSVAISATSLFPLGIDQGKLWGGSATQGRSISQAVARVQSLLGEMSVLVPEFIGGRYPQEAYQLRGWSEPASSVRTGTWPGALPHPWPTSVENAPLSATLIDGEGHPCSVGQIGEFICDEGCVLPAPAVYQRGKTESKILHFAGPWLQDTSWWAKRELYAWCQLETGNGAVLVLRHGGRWWQVGRYW
ncbi:protein ImuB [Arcanobacterium wilhelmae]|uniref:Protein ImuB n=2 Tax=Arcanobacterium wilhelmae TaxID=1803177 RepID=A0ABT9N8D1_9ACTO|nr:protein ImuB [Arcanobacterium wilhelmae]